MYLYLPVNGKHFSPYIGHYRSFGLRVLLIQNGYDQELTFLPDISTDFAFVFRLAHILTREQLDPIHLCDILEDTL